MTEHDKTVNFKANSETVAEAKRKLDYGEMSKELRRTLDRIAHGADVAEETRLTDRLENLREDRRDLRQERNNIEQQLEEIERDIERVERRLEQLRDQEGEYDGFLQSLDTLLKDGAHVFPDHGQIQQAAQIGGCDPEDVIEDLKRRNPDVPDEQFSKNSSSVSSTL